MAKKNVSPEHHSILDIDKYRLDVEWEQQPRLFMRYAEELAEAELTLDESEAKLEVVKAELDRDIRADPAKYDLEKLTEPGIKMAILASTEYTDAVAQLNMQQYAVNMLKALVRALEQRKTALENLVLLHGQSYFSKPYLPEDNEGRQRMEEEGKQRFYSSGGKKKSKK